MDLVVFWTALESEVCNEIPRTYKGIFPDKLNAFSIILLYLSILFKLNSIFKLPLSPSAENRTMVSRRTFWGFIIAFCKHCCLCFIECHLKRLNILFKPISKDWKWLLLDLSYGSYENTSCFPQIFWPE